VRGKLVQKLRKEYYSHDQARRLSMGTSSNLLFRKINAWVSDHFGIAVGIRVV